MFLKHPDAHCILRLAHTVGIVPRQITHWPTVVEVDLQVFWSKMTSTNNQEQSKTSSEAGVRAIHTDNFHRTKQL